MSTAIVVGGGIGGLAAAAMALKHFNRVILIERDDLTGVRPAEETHEQARVRRSGCPQYAAPHFLFAGGLAALEALLPGVTGELARRGARVCEPAQASIAYVRGRQWPRHIDTGLTVAACSRRLLDETIFAMLVAAGGARLTVRDRTQVAALLWGGKHGRPAVTGVALSGGESLAADVVFWAGGAASQPTLVGWLQEAGVRVPPARYVHWPLDYTFRRMRLPPGFDPGAEFSVAVAHGRPGPDRSGSVRVVEGGAAEFFLADYGAQACVPTDHEGWLAFAATLPRPEVAALAARCEPAGPILRHAFPPGVHNNAFQCLHKAKPPPPGLVVLGDALHTANPCFGQGMPLAIKGAAALDEGLRKTLRWRRAAAAGGAAAAAAPSLQALLYKELEVFWTVSAGEDLRGTGAASAGVFEPPKAVYTFTDMIMDAALTDAKVFARISRIMHMYEPVTKLALVAHRVLGSASGKTLAQLVRAASSPSLLGSAPPPEEEEEGGEGSRRGAEAGAGGDAGSETFEDAEEELDLDLMLLKDETEESAPGAALGVETAAA